ncbi:hypothetical protein BDFB_011696 [Asbolus verrucosus]|uniref:DDE 3 domain containing protein n=1 Tax=Asbolus verrucosus TaxID=1661398 RepID=A0A482VXS4_ASBVE|nr:hypothetical protein BDFB_011696 [Asbolus verrucosus]
MLLIHDGAPAHFNLNVWHFLNTIYGRRWIGAYETTAWPSRLSDLNTCDYYLWDILNASGKCGRFIKQNNDNCRTYPEQSRRV